MQTYCKPVKALLIGNKMYRTPTPAAKAAAWDLIQRICLSKRNKLKSLHGDAHCQAYSAYVAERNRLEKKAIRRLIPIMKKYFAEN